MGIGDWISSAFGSKNKAKAAAPKVDPNAYEYGGQPGGATEAASRYRGIGDQAQTRGAEQVNGSETDADRHVAYQARYGQQRAADQMALRASGQVPSIAQMQADRQMGQAMASQSAAAASARGAGGLALAQQNAANNIANMQGNISGQAQVNAAQERMQAEQAAYGAYTGMRSGDQQQQQMSAQQAQYQAQMNAQQRAQNDAVTGQMVGAEMGVNSTQLGAQQNRQGQQSANQMGAAGINAGVAGQNAATNQQNGWGAVGLGSQVAGAFGLGGPPKKAAGGPVAGNKAYLVGERGPELVIPARDGQVIPAKKTAEVLKPQPKESKETEQETELDRLVKAEPPQYRPMGGYTPPQLTPVGQYGPQSYGGPRAMGGYMQGASQGVDLGNNLGMSANMIREASTGLAGNVGIAGMVGGGGITGGSVDLYGGGRAEGGPVEGSGVLPLYDPPGLRLQVSEDGHGYYASDAAPDAARSGMSGLARMAPASPVVARAPVKLREGVPPSRQLTDEELLRAADEMEKQMRETHEMRMAQGPAVRPR